MTLSDNQPRFQGHGHGVIIDALDVLAERNYVMFG